MVIMELVKNKAGSLYPEEKSQNETVIESIGSAISGRCTCGGRGPVDALACPACLIWADLSEIFQELV